MLAKLLFVKKPLQNFFVTSEKKTQVGFSFIQFSTKARYLFLARFFHTTSPTGLGVWLQPFDGIGRPN